MNPEAFALHRPTKQELFNHHSKGIETILWKDGLKVMPDVPPRLVVEGSKYRIFVGAQPMKGMALEEKPKTLKQLIH